MILEAFAEYLRSADPSMLATDVLARWLWERLNCKPLNNVDRVLHCEMTICKIDANGDEWKGSQLAKPDKPEVGTYMFRGTSPSGKRLLKSLYEYCLSYEQQKWARWVHRVKASDFNKHSLSS